MADFYSILIGFALMTDTSSPLLALALDSAALHTQDSADRLDGARWLEFVLAAERSGISLVTLADTHSGADGIPRVDAIMLAAWLGARSSRIGVLAAADTTVSEPYLLATQVATVDFVSHGRAGWLAQVSGAAQDGGYVGPRAAAAGPAAWAEAAEYIEVVRALWDSWEDGAEIRDIANQRFIDRERIHHIDYAGEHLTIKGPSITPRSPQGQPPVAAAISGPDDQLGWELAAAYADVIFVGAGVDVAALRLEVGERVVRLLADIAVAEASVAVVEQAVRNGYDGVRLIPASLPGELEAVTELAAALGLASELTPGVASGDVSAEQPVTLREQLGLPRPVNRYSAAASTALGCGVAE
jgi:hypothetical protein